MYTVGNINIIAAVAVIGGGLFGFDISSMSAIIGISPSVQACIIILLTITGTQAYKCYFNQGTVNADRQCQGPTTGVQGGITAAMTAGSWAGALVSGYLSDILGRRKAIMIGCVIWIIGSAIICASQNIPMLVVGRIINGFCVGIQSAQVPVYISECVPPTKRGRLVGLQQWAITWGILILYYVSYGASFVGGSNQNADSYSQAVFRIPWGIQMVPGILLFLFMIFMPESPRWLARKDKWEECHRILTLIHGKGDPDSPFVQYELNDIKEACALEAKFADVTYWELFYPKNLYRTHIGMFTQIWSQLTGMNVMMYYITYIFGMAGYSGNANLLASSIQYIINVIMTVPALIWMDKWGRRTPLMLGAFFMMSFMFANAGLMGGTGEVVPGGIDDVPQQSMRVSGAPAKALIACTYLFVASYAISWGPVSWVYPPEVYPLRVRGKAVALATSANWAFNSALGAFVPEAFATIRWKVYVIFGVFNLAMLLHVAFVFPETAGKTLEEVQLIFDDPNGLRYVGTPAWKTKKATKGMKDVEGGNVNVSKIMDDEKSGDEEAGTVEVKGV